MLQILEVGFNNLVFYSVFIYSIYLFYVLMTWTCTTLHRVMLLIGMYNFASC